MCVCSHVHVCMYVHMVVRTHLPIWVSGIKLRSLGLAADTICGWAIPWALFSGSMLNEYHEYSQHKQENIFKRDFRHQGTTWLPVLVTALWHRYHQSNTTSELSPSLWRLAHLILRQKHTHTHSLGITRENEDTREKFPKTYILLSDGIAEDGMALFKDHWHFPKFSEQK